MVVFTLTNKTTLNVSCASPAAAQTMVAAIDAGAGTAFVSGLTTGYAFTSYLPNPASAADAGNVNITGTGFAPFNYGDYRFQAQGSSYAFFPSYISSTNIMLQDLAQVPNNTVAPGTYVFDFFFQGVLTQTSAISITFA